MLTVSKRALAVGVVVLAGSLSAAAADMTIVAQVTPTKGAPTTQTTFMTADKMRISDTQGADMILDLANGLMTAVDNKKKEFWQSTPEEREAFFAKIDAQMKQMSEQMANLPPALRKMAGGGMGGEVTVKKTAETKKIAGYNTTKYLVTMGESLQMEQWITTELAPPLRYFDGLKSNWASNPMLKNALPAIEEFKKIKGYPLGDTTTFKGPMGMGGTITREVSEVKLGAIPASTFDVPAGYKQKSSPFKN